MQCIVVRFVMWFTERDHFKLIELGWCEEGLSQSGGMCLLSTGPVCTRARVEGAGSVFGGAKGPLAQKSPSLLMWHVSYKKRCTSSVHSFQSAVFRNRSEGESTFCSLLRLCPEQLQLKPGGAPPLDQPWLRAGRSTSVVHFCQSTHMGQRVHKLKVMNLYKFLLKYSNVDAILFQVAAVCQ